MLNYSPSQWPTCAQFKKQLRAFCFQQGREGAYDEKWSLFQWFLCTAKHFTDLCCHKSRSCKPSPELLSVALSLGRLKIHVSRWDSPDSFRLLIKIYWFKKNTVIHYSCRDPWPDMASLKIGGLRSDSFKGTSAFCIFPRVCYRQCCSICLYVCLIVSVLYHTGGQGGWLGGGFYL